MKGHVQGHTARELQSGKQLGPKAEAAPLAIWPFTLSVCGAGSR